MTLKKNPKILLSPVLIAFLCTLVTTIFFDTSWSGGGLFFFFLIFAFLTAAAGYSGWNTLFYYWLVGYIILTAEIWFVLGSDDELRELLAAYLVGMTILFYYPISIISGIVVLVKNEIKENRNSEQ